MRGHLATAALLIGGLLTSGCGDGSNGNSTDPSFISADDLEVCLAYQGQGVRGGGAFTAGGGVTLKFEYLEIGPKDAPEAWAIVIPPDQARKLRDAKGLHLPGAQQVGRNVFVASPSLESIIGSSKADAEPVPEEIAALVSDCVESW